MQKFWKYNKTELKIQWPFKTQTHTHTTEKSLIKTTRISQVPSGATIKFQNFCVCSNSFQSTKACEISNQIKYENKNFCTNK